jgi:hypothetical protein
MLRLSSWQASTKAIDELMVLFVTQVLTRTIHSSRRQSVRPFRLLVRVLRSPSLSSLVMLVLGLEEEGAGGVKQRSRHTLYTCHTLP